MTAEQIEGRALRNSAFGYTFMAVLGAAFFFLTSSEAILLDGVYSFISLLMTFIARRVSVLVQRPYSERFHFGFAHFEPMLNVVRILLILAIAAFACVSALAALAAGGRPLNGNFAVIYGVLAAFGCLSMAWLQKRAARRTHSPLLQVDARNWLIDGFLSSGVAVTFVGAFLLRNTAYSHWVPYIDPALVLVMLSFMLPVPLKTLGENLSQVLWAAPDEKIQQQIRQRVETVLLPDDERRIAILMLPVGRVLYVQVHILLPELTELGTAGHSDAVKNKLTQALADIHPGITVDVIYTADEQILQV